MPDYLAYSKTIPQLGLVVSEHQVSLGCVLVDYQLIDNSSLLSNCYITYLYQLYFRMYENFTLQKLLQNIQWCMDVTYIYHSMYMYSVL